MACCRRFAGGALLVVLTGFLSGGSPASAKVFLTVEDGLELAFPGCAFEQRTVFLTDEQLEAARIAARVPIESAIVHPYAVQCGGEPAGFAYLDTHRVRTRAETILVALDSDARVRRIEILAFREPEEYIPRQPWYDQFEGRPLDDRLALKRDIRGVTGATLTAHATTDAVRRVLAIHAAIRAETEE